MPTLDWIGKKAVLNHHRQVPFRLLKCDEKLSVGDPNGGNLLIQGDNLEALKALLPYYAGQVKCIYIDPPYNTGNEGWIYNDNVNSPEISRWLGRVVGGESEDLSRHDKWLCMMYPRLTLLRDCLREDGVVMISIDDFEVHNLRAIMNEIYGGHNFIAQLVWDKTRKNDAKLFSVGHEYIVVYAKSLTALRSLGTKWRESKPGADEVMATYFELLSRFPNDFERITEELRKWYKDLSKDHPSKALSRYKHVDANGVWRDRDISWPGGGGPRYDVIHPVTRKACKVPERGWGFATIKAMQQQIKAGLVQFRDDHSEPPFRKAYLFPLDGIGNATDREELNNADEDQVIGAQVMPSVIHKQSQVAVKRLRDIFDGQKIFPNPKDHEILARLIGYVTGPNDLILDAFAGSGATGHAIFQLNRISGRRKFILIELDSQIVENITTIRLGRVINGYEYTENNSRKTVPGLGGGVRFCILGKPLFDEHGNIAEHVRFSDLASHIFFTETGLPMPKDSRAKSPMLGVHQDKAVYLLFNGIMGDKRLVGGNVLTNEILHLLPSHKGPRVIYGEGCRLSPQRLRREGIVFKQIPYEIKVG